MKINSNTLTALLVLAVGHITSTTALAATAVLEIEAEDAALNGSMNVFTSSSASGGQYIKVDSGDSWSCCSSNNAVFTFTVTQPGTYYLKGRILASSGSNDSFFVNVNGSGQYLWDVSGSTWKDDYVNDRNDSSNDVIVTLAAGTNTVTVYRTRR